MKKLVEVVLAPNDSGVLFSLDGARLATGTEGKIIGEDSYTELMKGDAVNGRKGYILIATEEDYQKLKKEGRVD